MRIGMLCLLIAAAVLLAACGCTQPSSPASATPTPAATTAKPVQSMPAAIPIPATTAAYQTTESVSDNTVHITKQGFVPAVITVAKGSQVRWVNDDESVHRIKFVDSHFSAFLLSPSQSLSERFNDAGTYDYSCLIKPYMQGSVHVE